MEATISSKSLLVSIVNSCINQMDSSIDTWMNINFKTKIMLLHTTWFFHSTIDRLISLPACRDPSPYLCGCIVFFCVGGGSLWPSRVCASAATQLPHGIAAAVQGGLRAWRGCRDVQFFSWERGQNLHCRSGWPKRCPRAPPAHHGVSICPSKPSWRLVSQWRWDPKALTVPWPQLLAEAQPAGPPCFHP